jgi:aminopeptidase YwaD
MNRLLSFFLFLFFLSFHFSFAQTDKVHKLSKQDKATIANLQAHINFLANDKLEGRRAGTNGEKLAREYISNEFQKMGVAHKGNDGYYQSFEIYEGKQINPNTYFIINQDTLTTGKDFFPLAFSSNTSLEATVIIAAQELKMPWFYNLKDGLEENKTNPHFDITEYLLTNIKKAKDKGASAIVLYNTSAIEDQLQFNSKDRTETIDIPVVYVSKAAAKKHFANESAAMNIKLKTDIGAKKRTGNNVVGYLDNDAATTVIIGAHFDHLGYGEDGGSRQATGEKQIHNGADDNASGTAALIELAKKLKNAKEKKFNFLFLAFSAEELGLNGSKYFAENPTIDLKNVNYMINMDMVGRLNDSTNALTVGGFGTSPQWSQIINVNDKKSPFVIKVDSSGTGPSDHTSFYRKDIPVLFFFTGLHTDYHKPSDDADKINYTGELRIINFISSIISATGKQDQKLVFTKTRETQTTTTARFSVSLGVMPDYTFAGTGVRIDGVSDGKAAQKAGMKAGDIIIQLGEHAVNSVENYMQTLGKFKKGDSTKIKFKRGQEVIEAPVQF